jgi:hypothetical protein
MKRYADENSFGFCFQPHFQPRGIVMNNLGKAKCFYEHIVPNNLIDELPEYIAAEALFQEGIIKPA